MLPAISASRSGPLLKWTVLYIHVFGTDVELYICCRLLVSAGLSFSSPDTPDNPDTRQFLQALESRALKQHVSGPTHKQGHTQVD